MSIDALSWAFNLKIENPGAKLVLLALANYANHGDGSYPSIRRIEELTSIKPRTIATHLNFLEEQGFVKRHPRTLANGGKTSNLYELCTSLPLNRQEGGAESAGLSYPQDYPREESLLRKGASSDSSEKPKKEKETTMFDELTPALEEEGNDYATSKRMLGKLLQKYGKFFVYAIFEENRELILRAESPYPYFIKILEQQKNKTPEDREQEKQKRQEEFLLQTALKEARYYHQQLYAGLEAGAPFDATNYIRQWPVLQQYADQIASGERELPEADKKAIEHHRKFLEQQLEEARYFGRI